MRYKYTTLNYSISKNKMRVANKPFKSLNIANVVYYNVPQVLVN